VLVTPIATHRVCNLEALGHRSVIPSLEIALPFKHALAVLPILEHLKN
jgi:hypothetical protein